MVLTAVIMAIDGDGGNDDNGDCDGDNFDGIEVLKLRC